MKVLKTLSKENAVATILADKDKKIILVTVEGAEVCRHTMEATDGEAERKARALLRVNWTTPEVTVTIRKELSTEFLKEVMDSAIDAISDWGRVESLGESAYMVFDVEDNDDGLPAPLTLLTLKTLANGIEEILSGGVEIFSGGNCTIFQAVAEDDASYLGYSELDCIVQAGMFGEIVFG